MKKRMKGAYSKSSPCDMWDGHDFVLRNMLRCNTIYNASMVVFRKAAIPADKTYMQFRLNGDWLFWVEIALQGKVVHINAPYNNFRQHEVKVTQTSRTDGTGLAELLRYFLFSNRISPPYPMGHRRTHHTPCPTCSTSYTEPYTTSGNCRYVAS